MQKHNDILAAEVLRQLVSDPVDDMPVILAKRIEPIIPCKYDLHDYGFEGLRPVNKAGKRTWEVYHDFVLTIDGATGACKIPDTPRNRQRLERLSQGTTETFTRLILDEATGKKSEVEETRTIPPTYERLEQSMAQGALVEAVAQKVLDMMRKAEIKDDEEDMPPAKPLKNFKQPAPPPADPLLEPLR